VETEKANWTAEVDASTAHTDAELPGQPEIIGAVNRATGPRDVVVQAAGSLPGDLQKLWRTRDALGYHVEYAFSCIGYEIAGGLKLIVVVSQHRGYGSIGHLSEPVGSPRFGTWYRKYDADSPEFRTDEVLPVDLAANARSYGIDVVEIGPGAGAGARLTEAVEAARVAETSTLIHINSDPLVYAPEGEGGWDVPAAAASTMADTQAARAAYEDERSTQRPLL